MTERKITTLYERFKNSPKKLKIICDWDEVIQATEPYSLWKALEERAIEISKFPIYFEGFWKMKGMIDYSPYGSKLIDQLKKSNGSDGVVHKRQQTIKNSPNSYQQAPFLTIAEDLMKLIKEDKVEKLIFLSAYDKRKFPNGDGRKREIFRETFAKYAFDLKEKHDINLYTSKIHEFISLELIPFDSEEKGQTKADWIKQNAADFDIVIDDNPNICRSIIGNLEKRKGVVFEHSGKDYDKTILHPKPITVLAPYYPAVENQHDKRVLLVKNEVSDLKKEDFVKKNEKF